MPFPILTNKSRMIYTLLITLVALGIVVIGYMNLPKFGRSPRGERLARIERSLNYRDGQFHNREWTPQITSEKSRMRVMADFLFEKRERNRPDMPLPTVKTDLKTLDGKSETLVWFGHSSYFIQSAGKRLLVDPVFEDASPVSFFNQPFEGTDTYKAADMPDIDYLIITHDHWDHLDYQTVTALKDRIHKVVCPLGVGEHLESWGYTADQMIELDWDETSLLDSGVTVHCLPARHFSGRTFKSNQTLWASFMIKLPSQTIFLSGDGGYGTHFAQIARQFPYIDLAIMENGQYSTNWKHIHLMPEDLKKTIKELHPKVVLTGHNGKYALSTHAWDTPLNAAADMASDSLHLIMPMIGEAIHWQDSIQPIHRWWETSRK